MSAVGKWVAGILSGTIVAVVAALILARIQGPDDGPGSGGSGDPRDPGGPAAVYLNRDSGAPGTAVRVSGKGFAAGESVTVRFHTEVVGHTETDGQGTFDSVRVEVPEDWRFTGQFSFLASGESSLRSAQREFRVT
jgi:hypothetical protein